MSLHDIDEDEEDEDEDDVGLSTPAEPVEFQFVSAGKVYRMMARGDWFDFPRLLTTVNRVLSDAGVSERFIAFETGNSAAVCLFGLSAQIDRLAAEFDWQSATTSRSLALPRRPMPKTPFSGSHTDV